MANVSAEQREQLNKSVGTLIQRLLTESCRSQTEDAMRYEGPIVVRQAFEALAKASLGQLISEPRVNEGMKGVAKYVDEEKIKAALSVESSK